METTRFILLIALGLVLTMIWQAWQEDYPSKPIQMTDAATPIERSETEDSSLPVLQTEKLNTIEPAIIENVIEETKGKIVRVKTDVLDFEINTVGGTVQRAALLDYSVTKEDQTNKIVLLENNEEGFYLIQGGLLSKNYPVNHKTLFKTNNVSYNLSDNESIKVPFYWESEDGLKIIKTFTFYKGQYVVDVTYEVQNNLTVEWNGSAYAQINRTEPTEKGSRFIYTYTGAVLSTPEKRYEKIDFGDIEDDKLSVDVADGWVAMLQHYFFTALIPGSKEETYRYYTLNPNQSSYVIGAITSSKIIPAGSSDEFSHRFYAGPKLQKELPQYADGLELTVDYGIFWFLAEPVFWLLDHIHDLVKNWGWSIVLVTLVLKLLFFKLSAAGYRSMANMRKVQPRLLSLRDRYKDDRQQLNQAMMALYKEEKINPLGGCFPILIQIPVFISLYWVLLESVELRQADFILWINDLSVADPYFVLPLLMGVTMFVQQKLNPAPMDPVQAKVMSVLPVVFTVFFAFFPAGLVLYWVVNNTLSIAQQWVITRNIEQAGSST
ncbi:MAG: membrane protein insertase YidC [Proteobacteria bacterium]|nr:membrane protein insertase YidC [Pseudomonadota bacterium]NOG60702.1 membrane protein insertase YidC [Pseudomonadota bacterium]